MKSVKKNLALLVALLLVVSIAAPARLVSAVQSTYTITHGGFALEFRVLSSWNAGYNAEIVLTNNTNQGLYQWVLNLNRDMGLLENGVQGGKLAHQQDNVTTIGYIDWNSYIPAGGSITVWLINTRTNGVVPVPTDFRINQATRRLVPTEDYTYTVNHHNEWDPSRFGLGLSTVNVSGRVIQGWELEFDINGRVETTSIGTLTHATTGAAIIIHTPRSNQSWHGGQNNYFTLGGTGSGVTITNLRIYEMIAEPYLNFADDTSDLPGNWPWPTPNPMLTIISEEVVSVDSGGTDFPLNQPLPVAPWQILTLTITPDEGYQLLDITVNTGDLEEGDHGDGYYVFTYIMPNYDVQITLVFEPLPDNDFPLHWPSDSGEVTLWFGIVDSVYRAVNQGIDIQAELGAPVYSVADGVITGIYDSPLGRVIVTDFLFNGQFMQSRHINVATATVMVGDAVTRGQAIGTKGLNPSHEEIAKGLLELQLFDADGQKVDPMNFTIRPNYDIDYLTRPMAYSMLPTSRARAYLTVLESHRRFMANLDLNIETGEVYLWRAAYNFVIEQRDHITPDEFAESGYLTWDAETSTATFEFQDIFMQFVSVGASETDENIALDPGTGRIEHGRMVVSPNPFIAFLNEIDWREFSHPESGTVMLTSERLPVFGPFEDIRIAIIRFYDDPYGEIYILMDGEWHNFGPFPFEAGEVGIEPSGHTDIYRMTNPIIPLLPRILVSLENQRNINNNPLEDYEEADVLLRAIYGYVEGDLTPSRVLRTLDLMEMLIVSSRDMGGEAADFVNEMIERALDELMRITLIPVNLSAESFLRIFQLYHAFMYRAIDLLVEEGIEYRYGRNTSASNLIRRRGFIHGQANQPQGNMLIGPMGVGSSHGCGPFAVYNALFYLRGGAEIPAGTQYADDRERIAENLAWIIRALELTGGLNVGGLAGTNPFAMVDYLNMYFSTDITVAIGNLDGMIQRSGASILLYHGGGAYIHYVMVVYVGDEFWIYNWDPRDNSYHVERRISEWLTADDRNYVPIALINISR